MSETKAKKKWTTRTKLNEVVSFYPVFLINVDPEGVSSAGVPTATDKDIECRFVEMTFTEKNGKERVLTFNFLDFFTFVYFVANEELRQQLQLRYERTINYLPYDVTFNLDAEEKISGVARRRIELPVDEITMAIARNEALKMQGMKTKMNMRVIQTPQGPRITSKLPKIT